MSLTDSGSGTINTSDNYCPICGKPYWSTGTWDFPIELCPGHPHHHKGYDDSHIHHAFGWQCPVCSRVLAPHMSVCPCYQERTATVSTDKTT